MKKSRKFVNNDRWFTNFLLGYGTVGIAADMDADNTIDVFDMILIKRDLQKLS